MYNYFTHVSNDVYVLSLSIKNMKIHELSYSLIKMTTNHWDTHINRTLTYYHTTFVLNYKTLLRFFLSLFIRLFANIHLFFNQQ